MSRNMWAVALVMVVGIILCGSAIGEDRDTVSATGKATVSKKPDIAYLTLYCRGEGMLMSDAVRDVQVKSEAIEKAILESYEDEVQEIKIIDLKVGDKESRFSSRADGTPRPQVVRRLRLTISPNPDLAYRIIDTAIRAGAVMIVPSLSFSSSSNKRSVVVYGLLDFAAAKEEAQKLAFEEAKLAAQKLAAIAGKKAGEVVTLNSRNVSSCMMSGMSRGNKDFPTEFLKNNLADIEIKSCVSVSFELIK